MRSDRDVTLSLPFKIPCRGTELESLADMPKCLRSSSGHVLKKNRINDKSNERAQYHL